MDVKTIEKKTKLTVEQSVKFQLLTQLVFFKGMILTNTEIDIMTYLVIGKIKDLSSFCTEATKKMYKIDKMEEFAVRSQNIRNIVNKLVKKNLVVKSQEVGKKSIALNPAIEIFFEGPILLNYMFLSVNGN